VARRDVPAPELSLIPVMNLVTLLIPFLLMSAQFVAYAVIDTQVPAICSVGCEGDADEEPVRVRLDLVESGYRLQASGPGLDALSEGLDLPCATPGCEGPVEKAWDVSGLRRELNRIKDRHPEVRSIILSSSDQTSYEALVLAMDATREDPEQGGTAGGGCQGRCLFPDVTLAASPAQ